MLESFLHQGKKATYVFCVHQPFQAIWSGKNFHKFIKTGCLRFGAKNDANCQKNGVKLQKSSQNQRKNQPNARRILWFPSIKIDFSQVCPFKQIRGWFVRQRGHRNLLYALHLLPLDQVRQDRFFTQQNKNINQLPYTYRIKKIFKWKLR